MTAAILCFLCKRRVGYKNKDSTVFNTHMKTEHMISYGLDYLLASCVMSEEERVAVLDVAKDVMQERIVPVVDLEDETTDDIKHITTVGNLHTKAKNLEKLVQGFSTKKLKITKGGEEITMKDLTSTSPVLKNRKGSGSKHVAQKGEDPGNGTVCPLCSKEFPKNGPMRRHFEDIHQPGEFPCAGCGKVFSSKNKMSSHYSRNCKRKTI